MIEANPELLMNNALRGHIVLQYVNQTELQFSDIQGGSFHDRKKIGRASCRERV